PVRQDLRPDPLPGIDYSFNPYVGCYHGCAFCYVPRLLQINRAEWGTSVVVKRNAASVLAKETKRLRKGLVAISTATDPYQFVEGKYRITRHALEVLLRPPTGRRPNARRRSPRPACERSSRESSTRDGALGTRCSLVSTAHRWTANCDSFRTSRTWTVFSTRWRTPAMRAVLTFGGGKTNRRETSLRRNLRPR